MPNTNVPGQIIQHAATTVTGSTAPVTPVTPAAPGAAPVASKIVTHFQFRKLFTVSERINVDNAQYNLTLSGSQKAFINTMQQDLVSATNVDLTLPDTINGINYLVSCGILTPARAAQILANIPV